MPINSILVPVEMSRPTNPVFTAALLIGRTFNSYIEGISLASFRVELPIEAMVTMSLDSVEERATRAVRDAGNAFDRFMQAHGVPAGTLSPQGFSFGWHSQQRPKGSFVGEFGRVFDMIVANKPADTEIRSSQANVAEECLFESGRPVLVVPNNVPEHHGNTILVAWNGSIEQARAITFAEPLLARANKIIVQSFGTHNSESGAKLASSFERRGLAVEFVTSIASGGQAGAEILSLSHDNACDLIIKGAYTTSRIRQFVFGGATQHILRRAEIPVLMAH